MTQDVPVAVECDVGRMRQTIMNFVGNAIKFTHRGKFGVKVGLDSHRDATPGQGKARRSQGGPPQVREALHLPYAQGDP